MSKLKWIIEFISDNATDFSYETMSNSRKLMGIICSKNKNARDHLYVKQDIAFLTQRMSFMSKLQQFTAVHNPDSAFRIVWELISMGFIFIQMILVPLILTYPLELNIGTAALVQLMDAFFMVDIMLNFNLSYYERGDLIVERKKIAINYLKLWFWIDFVAVFPYDELMSSDSSNSAQILKVVRIIKLFKIVRLLRVLKLGRLFAKFEESFSIAVSMQTILQFLKLAILIMSVAHWTACLWNIVELQQDEVEKTWMYNYGIAEAEWDIKYITALYFSVTTMITVGYGDVSPKTTPEMLFSIFAMVLASGIFGYSMSSVINLIQQENATLVELKTTNNTLIKYMKQKSVSSNLQSRVKNYLEWLAGSACVAKNYELQVLNNLSNNLQTEIINLLNGRIIGSAKILSKFSPLMITKLIYVLKERMLGPEEYVFQENSTDDDNLYFITNGQVIITLPEKKVDLKILTKGEYFGEIGFFARLPRCAAAKTLDFVNLMSLSCKDLWESAKNLDGDLQKLFYIRHSLEIEQSYKALTLRCYICFRPHHTAKSCTLVHYRPLRLKTIETYTSLFNSRCSEFIRFNRHKFQTLKSQQDISNSVISYYQSSDRIHYEPTESTIFENEAGAKLSFNLDIQKDYESFYSEYNLSQIVVKQNEIVKERISQIRTKKEQQLQHQWKKYRIHKQTYYPPNNTHTAKENLQLLNEQIQIESLQNIENMVSQTNISPITISRLYQTGSKRLQQLREKNAPRIKTNRSLQKKQTRTVEIWQQTNGKIIMLNDHKRSQSNERVQQARNDVKAMAKNNRLCNTVINLFVKFS